MVGLSLRDGLRSSVIWQRLKSRAAAAPRREEPVEVVGEPVGDVSWSPPWSNQEITSKQTQDSLAGLGPWCPPGVGGSSWGPIQSDFQVHESIAVFSNVKSGQC